MFIILACRALSADFSGLNKEYNQATKPILEEFCNGCHSTDKHKGDLDLQRFRSVEDIRKDARVWEKALEMLETGEMPPKEKPQPSGVQKERLSAWIRAFLKAEGRATAGDPGKVVLRRLSNFEYTQTIRDLTGINELDPARQFPVDGAAGEGFVNTGEALVMSPALLDKYFTAAKEVANHAVLLPDGFRFSRSEKHGDWVQELIDQIRSFYAIYAKPEGGTRINLQGIAFDTNTGGRLAVEKYLEITLRERMVLAKGPAAIRSVAQKHGVNAKYLESLWTVLTAKDSLPLMDDLKQLWRNASPGQAGILAAEIEKWQRALTRFQTVGHVKPWMVAVNPVVARHEIRQKLQPPSHGGDLKLFLSASDAGDGNKTDFVIWEKPRISTPGKPDVLLKDIRNLVEIMSARRQAIFGAAGTCLEIAGEAAILGEKADRMKLAKSRGVEPEVLDTWLDYLGVGTNSVIRLNYLTNRIARSAGYDFVNGWGTPETPLLVANSSDQSVRIPGNLKAHGVAMHPSPTLNVAVGWSSPTSGKFKLGGTIVHAHPECGNGVTWSLELRRGAFRQRLASGIAQGNKAVKIGPFENITIQRSDLVSVLIGPRDGNHSCDLTAVDFQLMEMDETHRIWDLAADVSGEIAASNPHSDRQGNMSVWHFYTEAVTAGGDQLPVIPQGSLLAKWQQAGHGSERTKLAAEIQDLLNRGAAGLDPKDPDVNLYRQLSSFNGPLLWPEWQHYQSGQKGAGANLLQQGQNWGMDPALFGKHPNGTAVDASSLCVKAPSILEVRLPYEMVAGAEFVATGLLHDSAGEDGSVQLLVSTEKPSLNKGLIGAAMKETSGNGPWGSDNKVISHETPILTREKSAARKRIERGFDEFRKWFPAALCYTKIVPVDEVVTLAVFHREDEMLCRLMLDSVQKKQLDDLWEDLHYVGRDALSMVDAFAQLMEYATQDSNPKLFEHLREPIQQRATSFKRQLIESETVHLDKLTEFARKAFRRPLSPGEVADLRSLYANLRKQELPHEEAFKLTLARVLVSPSFLYKVETPAPGEKSRPVNDWELASRLSYFLWSSMPDETLMGKAASGRLGKPEVFLGEARRMLKDPKVKALATEFACQWLGIRGFDDHDEKSEKQFPTFTALKSSMYEESVRFFTDLFRRDGSVLDLLNADHTFVNGPLAEHYGIEGVKGEDWIRVEGVQKLGRGGILGMASILSKQSGASRTSPILRGNWLCETLLGERLPKPPKNVPRLPESETDTGELTVRQITEKHSKVPECAVCHVRIDPFGYSLEAYDAIGRLRGKDLAGRTIDTHVVLPNLARTEIDGLAGLRDYLANKRREDVIRVFCRKLLGYSLGRGLKISDSPLVEEMQTALKQNQHRFSAALEVILRSRQFKHQRGLESTREDAI